MSNKNRLKKGLAWSLTILVLSIISSNPALAQSGYGNWHMGQWMMDGWGIGWFGMIFMVLFWGLIIVGLVLLVKWLVQATGNRHPSGVSMRSNAMEILKERYAKGEIDRDEFETKKKDLLQ